MNRREALKSMTTVLSLPVFPAELLAFGREMRARQSPADELRTLSSHQNETVTLIAERILPETDTPGAKAARVNEFIDLILTEWFTPEERDRFLQGLEALDQESLEAHGNRFKNCSEPQQVELLRAQESRIERLKEVLPPDELARQPFFMVMKWLTLLGYFTSEVGFTEELREQIAHRTFVGCAPLPRR